MGSLRELQVVGTGHHGRHKVVSPGRFAHVEISFCRPSAMTNGHPTWSIASTYPGSLVALQRGVYATKSPGSFFGGPGKMTSISLWCLGRIQNCGLCTTRGSSFREAFANPAPRCGHNTELRGRRKTPSKLPSARWICFMKNKPNFKTMGSLCVYI